MSEISHSTLRKVVTRKDVVAIVETMAHDLALAITVEDQRGKALWQNTPPSVQSRHAITVQEQVLGWVVGEPQSQSIATLLSYLIQQELEKKSLANELLEKYQEIDFFHEISTQITTTLELQEVIQLVLRKVGELLDADSGAILLLQPSSGELEILSQFGQVCLPPTRLQVGEGVIGKIVALGKAEIVNDVPGDPRFLPNQECLSSLICVPLKAKEIVIGAIAVGNSTPLAYTTGDLKLLSILASQAAVAIENALLYDQSCQAAQQAREQAEQLRQALRELQQTQAQLIQSEKMSSLGQLVAGVAHEINNPINFIYGNLTYATDYVKDLMHLLKQYQRIFPDIPPTLQAELETLELDFLLEDLPNLLSSMKVGADRILEIVQSLRNFSRLDEAEKKIVDIHEGIDSTLMILQNRLKAHRGRSKIEIIKQYADLPGVECYPGQLNQVFMNILVNAIDALEEQTLSTEANGCVSPLIRIQTEHDDTDQWVIIRISDNGPGMSEETLQRLYDPFFTTKDVGKGTGLGMAISHQIIVERHGGILKCRSQLGEGSEFWIQIPLQSRESSAHEASLEKLRAVPLLTVSSPVPESSPSPSENTALRLSTPDTEGFLDSSQLTLEPAELIARHGDLIRRLAQRNPIIQSIPTERLYQMFQSYPILLKLYVTLLS